MTISLFLIWIAGDKEMKFEELGLKREILEIVKKLGYTEPTQIQEKSIPLILEGKTLGWPHLLSTTDFLQRSISHVYAMLWTYHGTGTQ